MKTSELTGTDLDWAVAKCENVVYHGPAWTKFSVDWAQGGPIIEQHEIELVRITSTLWEARISGAWQEEGPSPLVAAMRCYVGFKMGNEVSVPGERAKDWTGAPLAYRIPGMGRFSS